MKITVIPTGNAPTHYSFNGETVTSHHDDATEDFDLSVVPADGQFTGANVDNLELPASQIIRDAYRDSAGELHVTLCQGVGSGHWEASDVIDSASYNPDTVYVKLNQEKAFSGTPKVTTREGVV